MKKILITKILPILSIFLCISCHSKHAEEKKSVALSKYDSIMKNVDNFNCDDGALNMTQFEECYVKEKELLNNEIEKQYIILQKILVNTPDLYNKLTSYHSSWKKSLQAERDFTNDFYQEIFTGSRGSYNIRQHFLTTYKNKLAEYIELKETFNENQ